MVWLAAHVGINPFNQADIILPNQPAGRPLRMEILQDIQFVFGEQLGGVYQPLKLSHRANPATDPTFLYRDGTLVFSDRLLGNDQDAIATLLHHVSHEWLQKNLTIQWSVEELDWFSDLLPVYLGWGIFGANTTVFSHSERIGELDNWRIASHRVLTSRLFGYGLALFAWGHGEESPRWQQMLRPDAKMPFRKMLTYLDKTGDSYFQPTNFPLWPAGNHHQLRQQLESTSPSILIATLW